MLIFVTNIISFFMVHKKTCLEINVFINVNNKNNDDVRRKKYIFTILIEYNSGFSINR